MMRRLFLVLVLVPFLPGGTAVETSSTSILIDSRDDWARLGFPGNGTADDPFRIENLSIDLRERPEGVGITVTNIPDHAVLRDVLVIGGKTGFVLSDIPNIVIENLTARRARIGADITGVTIRGITVTGAETAVQAKGSTIESGYFARNSVGIAGSNLTIKNSRFELNSIAVQLGEQTAQSTTRIQESSILSSRANGISGRGTIVVNTTRFDANKDSIRYFGLAEDHGTGSSRAYHEHYALTVVDCIFGNHTGFAIDVERPVANPAAVISPKIAAASNWWGIGPDGEPASPSPAGFGPPISDPAVITFTPILEEAPAAGSSAAGANHSAIPPPQLDVAEAVLRNGANGLEAFVRIVIDDPVGIENWTLVIGTDVREGKPEGALQATAQRRLPVPPGTTAINASLFTVNQFGRTATWNGTLIEAVEPPPVDNSTLPPPAPAESSAWGFVGVLTALIISGRIVKRR